MEHQKSNGRHKIEKPGTIAHAMDVLNDAAREASKESLMRAKDKVVKTGKHAANAVDNTVHENAWTAIGTTAALASVAGFFAGRKMSKRSDKVSE